MKYASFAFALGFLALGLGPGSALAATSTASFTVTATVQVGCQVSAPATVFEAYAVVAANATSAVSVACTNPAPYNVSRSVGLTTSAAGMMTGPASALLGHALLAESAHAVNWGRPTGTNTAVGTGSGSSQPYAVYGQTAGAQYAAPGANTDTITLTVTY